MFKCNFSAGSPVPTSCVSFQHCLVNGYFVNIGMSILNKQIFEDAVQASDRWPKRSCGGTGVIPLLLGNAKAVV